jgi:uncharacterized protein YabE (DUF348 family)/3D (Asp-Asp-Asp) domain-containing protein
MRVSKSRTAKRNKKLIRTAFLLSATVVILATFLSVQVFAKNTYVITDGSRTFTYSTFATDPGRVLNEAGLELDENDTYTTHTASGTSSITIRRSQNITITQYGEELTVSSFGETVEQLLERLNIAPESCDVLSVSPEIQTYDGMQFRIDQVLENQQTYTCSIPYETTYCYDASLPQGSQTVLTPGVHGELLCTATVTYINGVETRRTVHSEIVAAPPVTEVVAIGTAPVDAVNPSEMPIIGDGYIILPTGEVLTYTDTMTVGATAYYCEPWERGITYSGTKARVGEIAVDPSVIPLGTRMFIISNDGAYVYGIAIAEDTGYLIEDTRVDLYFNTYEECVEFGYRQCTVYFLGTED